MKPGSLITLKRDITSDLKDTPNSHLVKELPIFGKVYTCRDIRRISEYNDYGVLLEELNMGLSLNNKEITTSISIWKEVIIPPSIEAEIEEILEEQFELVEINLN